MESSDDDFVEMKSTVGLEGSSNQELEKHYCVGANGMKSKEVSIKPEIEFEYEYLIKLEGNSVDIKEEIDLKTLKCEEISIKSEIEGSSEDDTNQEDRYQDHFTTLTSSIFTEDTVIQSNSHSVPQMQHRSTSEVMRFIYAQSDSQTKQHCDIEVFNCDQCEFQTSYKRNLKVHHLQHKELSKVEIFSCSECDFRTKYKGSLKYHMLQHEELSQVETFNCCECQFRSKFKHHLKTHLLQHKNASKVDMLNCCECEFQTKYIRSLTSHMLRHKEPSEVEMIYCSECEFQTKYRRSLRSHML